MVNSDICRSQTTNTTIHTNKTLTDHMWKSHLGEVEEKKSKDEEEK